MGSINPVRVGSESLATYKDAFSLFDKDSDGTISLNELGTVMRSLGRHPTDEELRDILNRIDKDHNGIIDFAEFVDLMGKRELSLVSPALPGGKAAAVDLGITREEEELGELYAAFKEFDKDGSGKINITELGTVMNNLGEKLTEQELQMMIDEADLDGDHEISFSEFKKMVGGMK
ncbi:EF-hand [Agrocybe pediades]|nr:EF-hand [Agrocybe pediades]